MHFFAFLNGLAQQAFVIRTCGSELKTVEGFAEQVNRELMKTHVPGTKPDMKKLLPLALSTTVQNKVRTLYNAPPKQEEIKRNL